MSVSLLNKKIEYWEHQLLDLGKRNKMINYRETKRSTLKLVEPSFEELFQRLAINEETLTFQRAVDRETDIRVFSILSLLENLSSPLPVTIGDIKTEGSILERQKTLKNIRSKARLSFEEQGTNILYLSFGFIEWRDGKGASAQWIKSPIILVPSVLALEALNSPYTLSKHEDDIVINPTLQYYLQTEYGIELPQFDVDKDTIGDYLESLEEIADQRGWRILKEVSLGLLSFLKISMYNDLLQNKERIKSNPVIRAMAGEVGEANDIPEELRTFDLDKIRPQDCYQVMSADSSQQDAILYSKNHISFVMQGPPGTGKSQTITNIIAEALADGKKVLFVSEKMAALQIVYRRLRDAHLADFCLPLHSYKANKKEILEQIGANLRLKQRPVKDTALNSLEELLAIRMKLNQYASELHHPNPELNRSCYEIYNKLEEVSDAPLITFVLSNPLDVTQAQLQTFRNKLKEYSLSLQRMDYKVHDNPWEGLNARSIGYEYSEKMGKELRTLAERLPKIVSSADAIKECQELSVTLSFELIPSLAEAIHSICQVPEIPECWLDEGMITFLKKEAEDVESQCQKINSLENQIGSVFRPEIYLYDYNRWKEQLLADANGLLCMPYFQNHPTEYFIENVDTLQETFELISTALCRAVQSFSSINDLLGANFSVNESNQQFIADFVTLTEHNEIICENWFTEDILQTKALVVSAKENSTRLHKIKERILADWNPEVLGLDVFPLLLSLREILASCYDALTKANQAFARMNEILGTNFRTNTPNCRLLTELVSLIVENDIIVEKWFEEDLTKLKSLMAEAKSKSILLSKIKTKILADWEPDVLLLDYSPVLFRFKTSYTNFFKSFRPKYHHDKKQIQALSRTVIKELSDEKAIELLTSLRDYHEVENWFTSKKDELSSVMSSYFRGPDSDWDQVIAAMEVAEKLCAFPSFCLSPKLMKVLSADHANLMMTMKILLAASNAALEKIGEVTQQGKIEVNVDSENFNGADWILIVEGYLNQLGEKIETGSVDFLPISNLQYGEQKNYIRTLWKAERTKYLDDAVISLLIDLKNYQELNMWFSLNERRLSSEISHYFVGDSSDWDAAISAINTAEKLRTLPLFCITPELTALLSKGHAEEIKNLKIQLGVFNTAFKQVKEVLQSSDIEMNMAASDFDGKEALTIIKSYLSLLNHIGEQISKVGPYLVCKDTQMEAIYQAINDLNAHTLLTQNLAENSKKYERIFGNHFTQRSTNWKEIMVLLQKVQGIKAHKLYASLKEIITASPSRKMELNNLAEEISVEYRLSFASFEWLCSQFDSEYLNSNLTLNTVILKIEHCLSQLPILGGYIDYLEAKEECCEIGLADFISKIESAELYKDIEQAFLKGFYHMWLEAVCRKSVSVRRFRKDAQDERIRKFMELDDFQLLTAQMRIREKLIEQLPSDHQLLKATDEMAILKKELGKKRNIMPLRKLFRLIPNLLMKLKPCLMMSPLSVSYFLETEAYHFDLVIFDEASQIFPEDAIGAIFRGAQVIIAGDSKQLPPTNFFSATTNNFDGDFDISDEEDYNDIVSDSILEESASVLPNRTLLWHYRSKHESLIAFSNREIYQNNLITFPSSVTKAPDMGVEYIYVENGYYEGGGKNCNIREAQKCVILVLEHIQRHPERSLGIVAFSEKQQIAIENAIIDFRERNPKYEWFFDEKKDEPFFVKNLENVQGDERDTILFSICYAKDRNGKMYMRFGPLGHEGGERRLNVAITRAKCNVKLVGSILPADIDLSRTNSEGVRMLRAYIEFARQGTSALKSTERAEAFATEDEFCRVIVSFDEKHFPAKSPPILALPVPLLPVRHH